MRIIISIFTVVFLFCTFSCKSKYEDLRLSKKVNYIPYYLKMYEADSLYLVHNYKKSYKILDSLFEKFTPLNIEGYSEYHTYIRSAVGSNNFKKIKQITRRSFVDFGSVVSNYKVDSLLHIALQKSEYSDADLEQFIEEHKSRLNLTLRDTVAMMIVKDQSVRKAENISYELMDNVDSENLYLLKFILHKYGYPSLSKIGNSLLDGKDIDLGCIFLHANKTIKRNYLLDAIFPYVKSGDCLPSTYAAIYDRLLLDETNFEGAQYYGEFIVRDLKLVNPKKIDSIRKSVGLPHITYEKWRYIQQFGEFPFG